MQVLAILRRRTEAFSDAQFASLLDDEAEALRRLYAEGIVRSAWTREDVPGACAMLEAESPDQARAALARLPLVAKEMIEVQLIPLRGYRGFGPRA